MLRGAPRPDVVSFVNDPQISNRYSTVRSRKCRVLILDVESWRILIVDSTSERCGDVGYHRLHTSTSNSENMAKNLHKRLLIDNHILVGPRGPRIGDSHWIYLIIRVTK